VQAAKLLHAMLLAAVVEAALAQEDPVSPDAARGSPAAAASEPAAATVSNPEAETSGAAVLDKVEVTAQKRRESLQETPISIEAFNAEKLELRGIEGLQDLSGAVPSLTVEPFPTHNATLRIFIRGVGINDSQITQDAPVGVYMDGVYIARSLGLTLDVADIDRIEVLRGPQGTLYGRNTTGGAINLITKRPQTGAFSMSHKLSFGDRNLLYGRSAFNIPLADNLALKLTGLFSKQDGYVENTGPGGDFGDREEKAWRADLGWRPWDWLVVDYSYDHMDMTHYNYLFQSVLRPNTNKGSAELFKPYAVSQTLYSSERLDALATGAPYEPSRTRIDGHAATFTAALYPVELKYILGYRKLYDATYADLGGGLGSTTYRLDMNAYDGPAADVAYGGPTPLVTPTVKQDQWSHELQLSGNLFDNTLKYIAGLYYFEEEAVEDRHRLNHNLSTAISLTQLDELSASLPELGALLEPLGVVLDQIDLLRLVNLVDFNYEIRNRAAAAFGQATWTPPVLDERLHLTVGYRHSEDKREVVKFRISDSYLELNAGGQGTAVLLSSGEMFDNVHASRKFSDDSFSYIAAFDVTRRLNVYAKSVEAYKSGGYNVRDPHISGASEGNTYGFGFIDGFAPEYVQSYEAGFKSEWFKRRLRVNADGFYSRYRDMQINFLIPGSVSDTKTRNAGKARMSGAEVDITALLLPGLVLSADYAYLDAEVTEVLNQQGQNEAQLYPFTSAPRHSYVAGLDWTFLERGWGKLRASAFYNYTGLRQGQVITEDRRGLTSIPAYGVFNARLGANGLRLGEHGFVDVALWGRNLADKVYPVMAIDNVPHADRAVVWGEPRSYGLDLIYRYF
jgi:iron complex outermembrane receptor protein